MGTNARSPLTPQRSVTIAPAKEADYVPGPFGFPKLFGKHVGELLFIVSVIWFAVAIGLFYRWDRDPDNARNLLLWGLVPLGVLNGIKHGLLPGSLVRNFENDRVTAMAVFFERECGGANFAYAGAALQQA